MNHSALAFLLTVALTSLSQAQEPAIRVVVWDEQQPAQKQNHPISFILYYRFFSHF
jgi:hypothetical protein